MCPIVPIFTCGLLRSNFSFAIKFSYRAQRRTSSEPIRVPLLLLTHNGYQPSGALCAVQLVVPAEGRRRKHTLTGGAPDLDDTMRPETRHNVLRYVKVHARKPSRYRQFARAGIRDSGGSLRPGLCPL